MSEELTHCPKGCKNSTSPVFYSGSYWIKCSCGWQSPMENNHDDAVKQWNTRASGWISVDEQLPPSEELDYYGAGFSIPVFAGNEKEIHLKALRYSFSSRGWVEYDFSEGFHPRDFILPEITRWMPLPK